MKPSQALIVNCGEMWARNSKNLSSVPDEIGGEEGVYILYDGSTPVYIGKGSIKARLKTHRNSKRKGQLWDHFSWYVIKKTHYIHDIESLLLRMLPYYLRTLNKEKGKFIDAHREKDVNPDPERITRKLPAGNRGTTKRHA